MTFLSSTLTKMLTHGSSDYLIATERMAELAEHAKTCPYQEKPWFCSSCRTYRRVMDELLVEET